jgi:hypothetical protein
MAVRDQLTGSIRRVDRAIVDEVQRSPQLLMILPVCRWQLGDNEILFIHKVHHVLFILRY